VYNHFFSGGPVRYVSTRYFEADRIQNIA
jgi:hypothetical protein